jgi:hypothetical protein
MSQTFEGRGIGGSGYAVLAIADLLETWIIALALRELGLTTVPILSSQNGAALGLDDVRLVVTRTAERWPGLEALCARRGWPLARVNWNGARARPHE